MFLRGLGGGEIWMGGFLRGGSDWSLKWYLFDFLACAKEGDGKRLWIWWGAGGEEWTLWRRVFPKTFPFVETHLCYAMFHALISGILGSNPTHLLFPFPFQLTYLVREFEGFYRGKSMNSEYLYIFKYELTWKDIRKTRGLTLLVHPSSFAFYDITTLDGFAQTSTSSQQPYKGKILRIYWPQLQRRWS